VRGVSTSGCVKQRVARPTRPDIGSGLAKDDRPVLAGKPARQLRGLTTTGAWATTGAGGGAGVTRGAARRAFSLAGCGLGLAACVQEVSNFDPGEQERLVAGLRIKALLERPALIAGRRSFMADAAAGRVAPQAVVLRRGSYRPLHCPFGLLYRGLVTTIGLTCSRAGY